MRNSLWSSDAGTGDCFATHPLYCLGVSATVAVRPDPTPGRLAFVVRDYQSGGGLASADLSCSQAATKAKLPGSYKALLAMTTASAASRFNSAGATWVRLDGIALAPTAATFFSGHPQPLTLGTDGIYGAYWVRTGMDNGPLAVGVQTCSNWTSNGSAQKSIMGIGPSPTDLFQTTFAFGCDTQRDLYCLQE